MKKAKLKLPVVKRKNKWYNTLTDKYVSKAYAQRINNYFIKHPKETLFRAGGHGKIDPKKALTEQSRYIRELAYQRDIQIIRSKTRKGKTVYIAPFQKKIIERLPAKIEKLDYWLIKNKVKVELYRLTRDNFGIYHIIKWNVQKNFKSALHLESWVIQNQEIFDMCINEMKKIIKKYPFSKTTQIFGDIGYYVYSEGDFSRDDNANKGIGFGFVYPKAQRNAFRIMKNDYLNRMDHFVGKLDANAYLTFALTKITFYVYDNKDNVSKLAQNLASFRIGIIRYNNE